MHITISDADVLFMDETTGDIRINSDFVKTANIGDTIFIHYTEDAPDITHEYTLDNVDNDTACLSWKQQLNEKLTFGNKFDNKVNKQLKKNNRAEQKNSSKAFKKAQKLFLRDIKPYAEYWQFYLQNQDGTYAAPISQKELIELYQKEGFTPAIANATVVAGDWFVRKASEDFHKTGYRFKKSDLKPSASSYLVAWDVPTNDNTSKDEHSDKDVDADKEQSSFEDGIPASAKSKYISRATIDKFKKLVDKMNAKITDKNGDDVDINTLTTKNISRNYITAGDKTTTVSSWIRAALRSGALQESFLTEADVKLDTEYMFDPDEVSFKDIIRRSFDAEKVEKEKQLRAEEESKLKAEYQSFYEKFIEQAKSADDNALLDMLFNALVPSTGAAKTVAGELTRAIMRILFRDYNDGDKFFEGYGLKTCASSAEYLYDMGFENQIEEILNRAYYLADNDDAYTTAIHSLAGDVVEYIVHNPELIWTRNTEDSRDYSTDYISENQPRYEYEITGSDDVVALVENGVLSAWDLNNYVETELEYHQNLRDCEIERPFTHSSTTVMVSNLTADGYEELKQMTEDEDSFWASLIDEYTDELTSILDGEAEDDEYDDLDESVTACKYFDTLSED